MLHVFENRINKSYSPANDYVKLFTNVYVTITSKCVAYIAGAFVAVLLLTSVLDEAILLYVHTGDHNLIWYLGIFSAVYAAARSGVPDEVSVANQSSPEELVDKISACTHFKPVEWNDKCHTHEVSVTVCVSNFLWPI
jgi:autophagy-related protein 9